MIMIIITVNIRTKVSFDVNNSAGNCNHVPIYKKHFQRETPFLCSQIKTEVIVALFLYSDVFIITKCLEK